MGSDESQEHTIRRRKYDRSSIDDDVAPSKRRKHRHHRHKHDSENVEERVETASRHVVRPESDLEEGEIVEEDDPVLGIHSAHAEVDDRSRLPLEDDGNDSEDTVKKDKVTVEEDLTDGSRICNEGVPRQNLSYGNHSNGDIGLVLLKENYSVTKESVSPVKSRRERSNNDNSIDSKTRSQPLSSQDEDGDIHGRCHEDVRSRSRSHSRGRGRERSKSVSLSERVSPMKRPHKNEDPPSRDAKKTNNDSGDEIMAVCKWDSEHGYRDGNRHNDRGRSSSYGRCKQFDSHQSRESRDSEREMSREKHQYGRDMGSRRRRDKWEDGGESNRETASFRDSGRQTERKKIREREKERDQESDREGARVRDGDRERERTRGREEREFDREREWRKDRELERTKKSGRNRSRDRESYGERRSGRSRSRDRESYGDRESRRNIDDDRFSKNPNYEKKHPDDYDDRRMYKQSRSYRDDGTDYKNEAKKNNENRSRRDEEEQEEYQEKVALQLVDQEEDDLDRIKEESRKRRQAILEKYKMQQQQLHNPQLENDDKEHVGQVSQEVVVTSVAPKTLVVRNEKDVGTVVDPSFIVGKSLTQYGVSASDRTSGAGGLGEGTPKSETSGDMFCDDIFGDSPAGVRKTGKGDGFAIERGSLHDNWDDAEGYYSFRLGEVLDGRYEVAAAHGKGVFSTVVRAKDLKAGLADPEEVAIKIIRNNEHMHKAGKEELVILKKLVGADPENKRHCVRFLSSFKYRNHLCLVFESLNMNLREVLKKFGRNIGLKLTAVRLYSKQLFIALKHLRNCGVLHSDIKPDNMLVNEAKNVLKLCDFGNAMFAGKNEITPYLVSRFYRAPEIILGLPYDHPLDIWSVGCCIFELYSGKVLFPGATNNDMLRLHMELKGLFPKKMLRKGAFTDQHFDQDLNFLAIEEDPVTKKTMMRVITSIKPKDIGTIITGSPGEDPKMLVNFKDLLEKIFILDPDKRLTVSQALSHPFITGK